MAIIFLFLTFCAWKWNDILWFLKALSIHNRGEDYKSHKWRTRFLSGNINEFLKKIILEDYLCPDILKIKEKIVEKVFLTLWKIFVNCSVPMVCQVVWYNITIFKEFWFQMKLCLHFLFCNTLHHSKHFKIYNMYLCVLF